METKLSFNRLQSERKTKWIGTDLFYYETIDSTNTQARRLAEAGYGSGTLLVAEHQQAGRGRRGRTWESPAGTTILMSLLLKPKIHPNHASMLTLVTALAVSKAITKLTGSMAEIKWPNDIVMNGKKVCGILTEMDAQPACVNYVIIGIGINVNTEYFPEELSQMATSLYLETGKRMDRVDLIGTVWEYFEELYEIYLETQDLRHLVKDYQARLVNLQREVRILDPKESFTGIAEGITSYGELIVNTKEGQRLISSGEVSVRGMYRYVD